MKYVHYYTKRALCPQQPSTLVKACALLVSSVPGARAMSFHPTKALPDSAGLKPRKEKSWQRKDKAKCMPFDSSEYFVCQRQLARVDLAFCHVGPRSDSELASTTFTHSHQQSLGFLFFFFFLMTKKELQLKILYSDPSMMKEPRLC